VGQSPANRPPGDLPHNHSRIFFCSAAIFGRELAGFVEASDLGPKKTSVCRILTEMAQPKIGQPLSAAEYLFSVSSCSSTSAYGPESDIAWRAPLIAGSVSRTAPNWRRAAFRRQREPDLLP
jgi:hypothetical protein